MRAVVIALVLACISMQSFGASLPVAIYTLTGGLDYSTFTYPAFNISIPEDGVTIPIGQFDSHIIISTWFAIFDLSPDNPLIVWTISPVEAMAPYQGKPTANCTFMLEDGSKAYVATMYDIPPQRVTSVSCVPLGGPPSTVKAPFTMSTGGLITPFPTRTGISFVTGSAGVTATHSANATATSLLPFTGAAGKMNPLFKTLGLAPVGFCLFCGYMFAV